MRSEASVEPVGYNVEVAVRGVAVCRYVERGQFASASDAAYAVASAVSREYGNAATVVTDVTVAWD